MDALVACISKAETLVSEIRPFLLGPSSLVGWIVTVGAVATADLLDFFPICLKLVISTELYTRSKTSMI